tara:strand:+ start:40 stop:663 length:624 start_codon:yes stop_codon:yes gene_type:complete
MTTKKKTTTKAEPKSIWHNLSKINVNDHTEIKGSGNFTATYLSWSWAWGILMEHYPNATFENHLNQDGYPCFFDHNGNAMVRVTICIEEKCHTEDFMVTDFNNKAIKNPDSFAINTALKRCLVKCMAYFGLGHYIYAGEDLPHQEEEAFDREHALGVVNAHINFNADEEWQGKVLFHFKAKTIDGLTDEQLKQVVARIPKKEGTKNG